MADPASGTGSSSHQYSMSFGIALFVTGLLTAIGATYIFSLRTPWEPGMQKASPEQLPGTVITPGPLTDVRAPLAQRIVIVGGGLAGCTAALAAQAELQRLQGLTDPSVEVVVVDKMPKLGGNSAKASSGINALTPEGGDSVELFEGDTLKSGGELSKPELVKTLVEKSQDAIRFLEGYGVDLSKVTQLGGHTVARSHTNPVGGNVGWSIMSKLMAAVKGAPGVKVMEGHKLEEILLDEATGVVSGVRLSFTPEGKETQTIDLTAQAVILATGGFAANRALLAQHNPEAAAWATTNGPWAQGDVLDVAERVGARLIHLDQVQVHPTGFIDPADEAAGTKFLAPEKLRGVGAMMLNKRGERFVDELATRDVVSTAVAKQPGQEAYLLLPAEGAAEYGMSAIQFYVTKGLMSKVQGVSGLAQHMGLSVDQEKVLLGGLDAYNQAREGHEEDKWGKTVFPAGFDLEGEMYVARITPVVHYTMGGVEIDPWARVLSDTGKRWPIPGLYAAGEASGGVHGRNRLGGNSLLECAVFGTIAGQQAVAQLLNAAQKAAASAL